MVTEEVQDACLERRKEREKAGWGQQAGLVQFLWLLQCTSILIAGTWASQDRGINIREQLIT